MHPYIIPAIACGFGIAACAHFHPLAKKTGEVLGTFAHLAVGAAAGLTSFVGTGAFDLSHPAGLFGQLIYGTIVGTGVGMLFSHGLALGIAGAIKHFRSSPKKPAEQASSPPGNQNKP